MSNKSLFQIEMDYKKAMNQVDELHKIAKKLNTVATNDFEEVLSSVSGSWKGESSTQFIKKGSKVQGDLEKRAKAIDKIADTLKQMANNIRAAELQALKAAQIRVNK